MPHSEKDPANLDMCSRMIRAAGRRAADFDENQLARLQGLHSAVDAATADAVAAMRARGVTWAAIGAALGVTRQAALMRWGGHTVETLL